MGEPGVGSGGEFNGGNHTSDDLDENTSPPADGDVIDGDVYDSDSSTHEDGSDSADDGTDSANDGTDSTDEATDGSDADGSAHTSVDGTDR